MDRFDWRLLGDSAIVLRCRSLNQPMERLRAAQYNLVLLDAEPLLVHWRAAADDLEPALDRIVARLGSDTRVLVCTNSSRFAGQLDGDRLVDRAHKPWTSPRRVSGRLDQPVGRGLVIGDLLCLDGLLALRLGFDFVWVPGGEDAPWWPRLLERLDRLLRRLMLRELPRAGS